MRAMPSDYTSHRLSVATTHDGGIDSTALIGRPPQLRAWTPGDPQYDVLVHRTARIEAYTQVDCGSFRHTEIGARTWLMKMVHVGHDVVIGEDCELAPGAVVCGEATIGDRVRVGVNASILPRVSIGTGARIGAGSVVTRDVPAGETWAGNPARNLHARMALYGHQTIKLVDPVYRA